MDLQMQGDLARSLKSLSQKARVVTEAWCQQWMYCANCESQSLEQAPNNEKVYDYKCLQCSLRYQLKSQSKPIGGTINDGDYKTMIAAVREDRTPDFLFLEYEMAVLSVRNLVLVPHFVFTESAIIQRPPLAPTARRAGWIGCNISLKSIAPEARIPIVLNQQVIAPKRVRQHYARLKPLKEMQVAQRGWTLDVLTGLRELGMAEFTTEQAYALVPKMQILHPGNRHVRDKIRQQLQVLRDAGLLLHLERGRWCLPRLDLSAHV